MSVPMPEQWQARQAIGTAVETLIALLDTLDGDADCEPDDEPEGDDEPEDDDPAENDDLREDDDPGGGNVDDDGEGIDEREPDDGI